MFGINEIKYMNSPEGLKQSNSKTTTINDISDLETEIIQLKEKLNSIKKKFKRMLISRLNESENKNNTLPVGTEIKICDSSESHPVVEGTVEHETKKFYVINGKRYHKYGLKFYDVKNEKVILEDTRY